MSHKPLPATDIPIQSTPSLYPEPFSSMIKGRIKRKLGDHFNLNNYGINLTELAPGSMSALKHRHTLQDEFIYILTGTPTLFYGDKEYVMQPGDCFGFAAGGVHAHQLVNRSSQAVCYLEIGDRTPGDKVEYPDNDLQAHSSSDGTWLFTHKDGQPY